MRRDAERGAILIMVALALVVVCAFCALVIDYGVLVVARAQAQNAADAGALAGATALAFDSVSAPFFAEATSAATDVAQQNLVWGSPPSVPVGPGETEVLAVLESGTPCQVPDMPTFSQAPCIRVNVYRDELHGNPLPTFFAPLFNIQNQGVRASAVAAGVGANTSSCVWPLAVPDKWQDISDPPTATFTLPDDIYYPPIGVPYSDSGTGYTLALDKSAPLTLTEQDPTQPLGAQNFIPVEIGRVDGGGFGNNLDSCNSVPVRIGDTLQAISDPSGSLFTVVQQAVGTRLVAPPSSPSPRLVLLPLFDPRLYPTTIKIVNFMGFILEGAAPTIQGLLATYPGTVDLTNPENQVPDQSAFLRSAILFR